jgi:hypothetical protein
LSVRTCFKMALITLINSFMSACAIGHRVRPPLQLCGLEEIQGKWKFMKSKKEAMRPRFGLVSILEGKCAVSDVSGGG